MVIYKSRPAGNYERKRLKISVEMPIYMMLVGMLGIQIAAPLKINAAVSLGTWMIVFSSFIAAFFALVKKKIEKEYLLYIISLVASIVASMIFSFTFTYQSIVVAISFLEIPLLMVSYNKCKGTKIKKAIYASFLVLSIYYQYLYLTPLAYMYQAKYGNIQAEYLTLGYNNPNETAMYLIACFFVLVTMVTQIKRRVFKYLMYLDILLLGRLMILTLSRTAILTAGIFLFSLLMYRKRKISRGFKLACFGTSVLFIILTFVQKELGIEWFFLGESIETGRLDIYTTVIENMNFFRVFLGRYEFYFKNLHNGIWCIFATIGIIGTVIYYRLLYRKINENCICNYLKNKTEVKFASIGLLCVIIYTSTEAAFLTAGGTFAAMVVSLYILGLQSV